MKQVTSLLLILLCSTTLQASFSGTGAGTSGSPYQITTPAQLDEVRNDLTAYYILNNNIDMNVAPYNTGSGWVPIGIFLTTDFTGNFNGNGKTIANIFINRPSTTGVGFFGSINGATISNLAITGAAITGDSYTGGLMAYGLNSIISGCYVKGAIVGTTYVGGLAACGDGVTITNCYSICSVSSSSGGAAIGGLIGRIASSSSVTNCYSACTLSGYYPGGLIGSSYSVTVTNSFWDQTLYTYDNSYGGTGKTTTEMKTLSTFTDAGWSNSVWEMIGTNYPRLKANRDAALPVELSSFTSSVEKNGVTLNWKTATETNNYGFEVERATKNGTLSSGAETRDDKWTKIGFVEGSGTTNAPKSYSFTDKSASGKTSYRLKQIDRDGKFEYSQSVEVTASSTPKEFGLEQNYPNPFNPTTAISYQLSANSFTTLIIYDAIGREVATLVNEVKEAGTYSTQFDGAKLSSGVYFAKLTSSGKTQMKKLLLLK